MPKDVYEIDRLSWDKRSRREMDIYEVISNVAESKGVKVPEYIKDFLIRHIDLIKKDV